MAGWKFQSAIFSSPRVNRFAFWLTRLRTIPRLIDIEAIEEDWLPLNAGF